jgi:ABC-type transport system substrate-binding protein
LAAVVAALAVGAAACGDSGGTGTSAGTTPSSGAIPEGGTFIDGAQLQADNLTSFDPGLVQTLDEAQVTYSLYDGLTDFDFTDKTKPVLKGLVAEKWVANANATEYTFTIKKGLVFSNGDPVLPSSFKYAWVRNGQKSFASPYGYLIDYIKGGALGLVHHEGAVADHEALVPLCLVGELRDDLFGQRHEERMADHCREVGER